MMAIGIFGLFVAAHATGGAPPALYMSETELMSTLKAAAPAASGMTTAPVKNLDHYRINVVQRTKGAGAIAHPGRLPSTCQ